jgi:hypothetical protein
MDYSWVYKNDVVFIVELTQNQDNSKTDIILDKIHKLILEALDRFSSKYPPEKRTKTTRKRLEELERLWREQLYSLERREDISSMKLLKNTLIRIKQKYVGDEYVVSIKKRELTEEPYNPNLNFNTRAIELSLENILYNGLDFFNGRYYEERIGINEIVKSIVLSTDLDEDRLSYINWSSISISSFIEEIFYYKWLKKTVEIYEQYQKPISETYIETSILNQFKTAKSKLDSYLSDPQSIKPNKRHWVLFHYYLQKAHIEPKFPIDKKKEAIALLCQNNVHFGDKTNFEKYYNEYQYSTNRLNQSELINLELVEILLSDFPQAQNLVQDDITKANKLIKSKT